MTLKFSMIALLALVVSSFCNINLYAQSGRLDTINQQLKSGNIIVSRFEWTINDSLKTSDAKFTITNKFHLAVKSVTASMTGQNKNGIMLQSGGTHTLRRKTVMETILPNETKTVVIKRAFNSPQLDTLILKELIVEYENGSIELLK